jgi:AcrR family transcriptional regulator
MATSERVTDESAETTEAGSTLQPPPPYRGRGDPTGERILDAAESLLRERGAAHAVRLADVAGAAGVSRQSVYLHFQNRAGLWVAVTRRMDERLGFVDKVAEICCRSGQILEPAIRAWLDYVPQIMPVASALEAAGVNDDAGAAAFRERMEDLRSLYLFALDRVAAEGLLADGWTIDTAADWIWARTHPTEWQHVVIERGWEPDDFVERTVRSILAEVVRAGVNTRPLKKQRHRQP